MDHLIWATVNKIEVRTTSRVGEQIGNGPAGFAGQYLHKKQRNEDNATG